MVGGARARVCPGRLGSGIWLARLATAPGANRVGDPAPRWLDPAQCWRGDHGAPWVCVALAAPSPSHAPRVAPLALGPAACERSDGPDGRRGVGSPGGR